MVLTKKKQPVENPGRKPRTLGNKATENRCWRCPAVPLPDARRGAVGSGERQLLVDMLTRIYAGSWERIYVFSPSVHLDSVWGVVKDHVHNVMGVLDEEQSIF